MSRKCCVVLSVFCVLILGIVMTASAEWVCLVRIMDLVKVNGRIAVKVKEDGVTDVRRGRIKMPNWSEFKQMTVVGVENKISSGVLYGHVVLYDTGIPYDSKMLFNPTVVAEGKNASGKWISGNCNFYRNPLGYLKTVTIRNLSQESSSDDPNSGGGCVTGAWFPVDFSMLLSGLVLLMLVKR
ncbi:MAG: hypothetical protein U9Q00_09495 [Synergistota bacterium]|nr:hypothetical protein [Synergistota bacterium]